MKVNVSVIFRYMEVFFLSIFKTLLLHKFVEKNQFNENMLYRWEFHIVKLKNNSKRQVREKNFSV